MSWVDTARAGERGKSSARKASRWKRVEVALGRSREKTSVPFQSGSCEGATEAIGVGGEESPDFSAQGKSSTKEFAG